MGNLRMEEIMLLLVALLGVIMAVSGNPLFLGEGRYTEESRKKYARVAGVFTCLAGLSGFGFQYTLISMLEKETSGIPVIILLVLVIICLIGVIASKKKYLVKK